MKPPKRTKLWVDPFTGRSDAVPRRRPTPSVAAKRLTTRFPVTIFGRTLIASSCHAVSTSSSSCARTGAGSSPQPSPSSYSRTSFLRLIYSYFCRCLTIYILRRRTRLCKGRGDENHLCPLWFYWKIKCYAN
jgi:hypothetical protein